MAGERILIVDDEPGVRSMLEAILRDDGYVVEAASSGEDGLAAASARPPEGILLDVWLPGIDGLQTLERLRDGGSDAEIVMISGHGTIDTAVRATKLGAFDFVEKPLSLEKTLLVLRNALRQRRLARRNRALLDQLSRDTEIVGTSPTAERLRREADAAAAADAPVLLAGEPGSGREIVARRIHAAGRRADQAFVSIPCAVLEGPAGAGALFGDAEAPGRLALAERGSVLFEDLDLLAAELQTRLAAWATEVRDVRLMASVAPGPAQLAAPLRERLEVVRIEVAPLRDRREDVRDLVIRFVRDLSREYGRPEKRVHPAAMAALVRHDWPGNIRALHNAVERLVLLGEGEEITVEDLPADIGGASTPPEDLYAPYATLADGTRAFERFFLRRALAEARGDTAEAARRSGIDVASFRKKLGPERGA